MLLPLLPDLTFRNGATITLTDDPEPLVVLQRPGDPTIHEVGRVIDGMFQPALIAPQPLTPSMLRAIAALIDNR